MRRRHRPCGSVVPHFPRTGAVGAARAGAERSWRGSAVRGASEDWPTAFRDGVTLPKGSATQVLRRPAAAVDRGAERGPRRPAFRPRTVRQGAAAAADDGLGRDQGRGVTPPRLWIAVGEDRDNLRRGRRRGGRRQREGVPPRRQGTVSAGDKDAAGPKRDLRPQQPDRAADAPPATAEVIRGNARRPKSLAAPVAARQAKIGSNGIAAAAQRGCRP